jgi:integrase
MLVIGYHGFFRISELIQLTFDDLCFEPGFLKIKVRHSKTDQVWKGEYCFISETETVYSAYNWTEWLCQCADGATGLMFPDLDYAGARKGIRNWLKRAEVNPKGYGTHSLRRGGATAAAKKGIQDSVIQAHGRWKSTCFMKYTSIERRDAGVMITTVL